MIPESILEGIKWDTHRPRQVGGQQAGTPNYGVRLIHEDMGFEIGTDAFRSSIEGREFCLDMFELFLKRINAI